MPVCGIYIYCVFITRRVHARMWYIYILCVHNPESACPYVVYIYIVCS